MQAMVQEVLRVLHHCLCHSSIRYNQPELLGRMILSDMHRIDQACNRTKTPWASTASDS